jgi:GNAT superfamily N-acetyltransferase
MTDATIRPARRDDAADLVAVIWSVDWLTRLHEQGMAAVDGQVRNALARCGVDASHIVFVAEAEGRAVGYVCAHWLSYLILPGPEGFVSDLLVHADFRGQGLGTRLLDAIGEEARRRGAFRLHLLNGRGRESYDRRFYAKRGWTERPDLADFILKLD